MIRLKMCGLRSVEDVDVCARAGCDALGFVFASGPRRLELDQAAALTSVVPPSITRVGVFANATANVVEEAASRCALDILQFAGDETPEFCGSFGLPTLITVRRAAPPPDALQRARAIGVIVDAAVDGRFGGTGVRANSDVARQVRMAVSVPFILAGGLTPQNVGDAIHTLRPGGVDVSSGIERDGRKDPQLVIDFARAVKVAYDGTN